MQANIDNTVDMEEFRFLLTGGISAGEVPPNPLPWLGDKLWAEMNRLSSFLGFVGFAEELHKEPVSPFLRACSFMRTPWPHDMHLYPGNSTVTVAVNS